MGRTFQRKFQESNNLLGCHGSPGRSLSVTVRQQSSLPCQVSRLWRSSRLRHGGRAPQGCLVAVDAVEVEAGGLGSLGAASSPSTPSTPSRSRQGGSEPLPSALPHRRQRRRRRRGRSGRAPSLCLRRCLVAVSAVDAVEVAAGGLGALAFGAASSLSAPSAPLREGSESLPSELRLGQPVWRFEALSLLSMYEGRLFHDKGLFSPLLATA